MRIAATGTHSIGKSTFIEDFLIQYPDYIREMEPYRVLRDVCDIELGPGSPRICNGIQFYYSLSRVLSYTSHQHQVIFDRLPVDFLAYGLFTHHHGEPNIVPRYIESLVNPIRQVLCNLDLLLFFPIPDDDPIGLEEDGIRSVDAKHRREVDVLFKEILRDNKYQVLPLNRRLEVVEISGTREERIAQMSKYLR